MVKHPLYRIWSNMIQRCENPKNPAFDRYGGRGIRVCSEWRASFERFVLDIGERPSSNHSIDRINNDGDYEPHNVRWATMLEQNRNRRPRSTGYTHKRIRLMRTAKGYTKSWGRWRARFGKEELGVFETEAEARAAYEARISKIKETGRLRNGQ